MTPTRVLICGSRGQLGNELKLTKPSDVEYEASDQDQLDITDSDAIARALDRTNPRIVINAAAYTAVDKAESDEDTARAVNGVAPGLLARHCAARGLRLIHVSTDFVFDGGLGRPYAPDAAAKPLGVYGQTKLEGERAVLDSGADAIVVRTGWVYSRHGGNFVKTMLRLMAERDALNVVEDQVGTPTWARGLAEVCWRLAGEPRAMGVYHWSDAGVCSWYDFALAIRELGLELGLLDHAAEVHPIPSSAYPTPATRPAYSVLDKRSTRGLLELNGRHWREQLAAMLLDLKTST